MKYAFIFGTSAFIVPQNIIKYANELLQIVTALLF
jgi:hypothetical protein